MRTAGCAIGKLKELPKVFLRMCLIEAKSTWKDLQGMKDKKSPEYRTQLTGYKSLRVNAALLSLSPARGGDEEVENSLAQREAAVEGHVQIVRNVSGIQTFPLQVNKEQHLRPYNKLSAPALSPHIDCSFDRSQSDCIRHTSPRYYLGKTGQTLRNDLTYGRVQSRGQIVLELQSYLPTLAVLLYVRENVNTMGKSTGLKVCKEVLRPRVRLVSPRFVVHRRLTWQTYPDNACAGSERYGRQYGNGQWVFESLYS
ncbi:hypothetical protein WMY93_026855 [Mugilogobius chulae]|uniref:Uncharacterized protein n=1 Tax=Mugilogobius chulae TaxID=88201 RepID=A0AAW0MZP5_9GOBI